jgi:GNAT superfamily N-acetyltransferase
VTVAGWQAGYREIVAPEHLAQLPVERWRHEIGVGLKRPVSDAFTYVAEIDGGFAGYCYVAAPSREADLGEDVAELVAMYVDPERWRQGVADALMGAAMERLSGLPYEEVVLWTFKENARAIAF